METRRIAPMALLKVLVALSPIELDVHAGLALIKLPTGMMPPEVLATSALLDVLTALV